MRYALQTIAVVVLFIALPITTVRAQPYGLQVAESVETRSESQLDITAGVVFNSDGSCVGLRDTFACTEDVRIFAEVGAVTLKDANTDLAAQGGFTVSLPIDVPFDLGVRGAVYGSNGDATDTIGGNLMALASKEAFYPNLFFYGGLGLDYRSIQTGQDTSTEETDRVTDPLLSLGTLLPLNEHLLVYIEVTVTDDPFIGCGLRYR